MKVRLSGSLTNAAGGRTLFDVEAGTINQILLRLGNAYPELAPLIEEGVSVAVDGVIYRGDFTRLVQEDSEVVLIDPIVGG